MPQFSMLLITCFSDALRLLPFPVNGRLVFRIENYGMNRNRIPADLKHNLCNRAYFLFSKLLVICTNFSLCRPREGILTHSTSSVNVFMHCKFLSSIPDRPMKSRYTVRAIVRKAREGLHIRRHMATLSHE